MNLSTHRLFVLVLMVFGIPPWAMAQMAGSRLGVENQMEQAESLPRLDRDTVEGFITVEGRAEVRVRPTQIRVVLAVTSAGETAQDCQRVVREKVTGVKSEWAKLSIAPENVVEDFIAILPVHEWDMEQRGESEVGVEKQTGYRLQTNLHLSVPNDAKATAVLDAAFAQGITDIIAFDYWSGELDAAKLRARELALQAGRSKADLLFKDLLEVRPRVINVQEQTTVRRPEALYHSFENSYQEEITPAWKSNVPLVRAYRPRNTYYRGLFSDADVQSPGLPMQPEISVVSTVRIYFQSPAAVEARKAMEARKAVEAKR